MRKLYNILLIVCIACFGFSAYKLGSYYFDSYKSSLNISKLAALVVDEAPTSLFISEVADSEVKALSDQELMRQRYGKLIDANEDFIGWIKIDSTDINYPVMFTPNDPEFYLHTNFEKEYDYSGLPFVDGQCQFNPSSTNLIIYGHNMKSNTMFSTLLNYQDKSYYQQHPLITFDTIYGSGTYGIVAVILSNAYSVEDQDVFRYYSFINATDEADFNEYMDNIKALALYETDYEAQYGDQLITLSTCEYSQEDGRLAVIAKKLN